MKNKELEYQKNAVEFAIKHLEENKVFNLQAPTGSGKTFIISLLIEKYIENEILSNSNTTFIFIAPSTGKLEHQGYEKITNYLNRNWVKGFNTKYIGTSGTKKQYLENIDYFKPNTVYFFGWQMFKKGTKISELDSERNDIYKVILNTQDKKINIVLIIDEAHIYQNLNKFDQTVKKDIISTLNPFRIINVSATLEQKKIIPDYKIEYEYVREECAIKKQVTISSFDENIKDFKNYTENELLIYSALNKQDNIKEEYRKNKIIGINPLILIQIPNDINNEDSYVLKEIKSFLEKKDYKKDLNYAIWLNNEKTKINKDDLIKNNSPIDILIFKQAIAIGWDVPRANILVRLRDTKEKSFNIQTLGRILRNQFFKYYNNDLIDNAFVFTNDDNYKSYIKEESICVDESMNKIVHFSEKVDKSLEIKINKVLIKKDYSDDELIQVVGNELIKSDFFKKFIKLQNSVNDCISQPTINIDSRYIYESNADLINKELERNTNQYYQQEFIEKIPKETLVFIYIKYKKTIKSSKLINEIMDFIISNLNNKKITIKNFLKLIIRNWDKYIKENDNEEKEYTFKTKIESLIDEFLSRKTFPSIEPYILPNNYKINQKLLKCEKWDNINTYEISLSIDNLESINEKEFYDKIRNSFDHEEDIHIFRNGVGSQDYYIEYLDWNKKIRKFFPDFFVINNRTKQIFIAEAKNLSENDVDKNTKLKIRAFNSNINLIDANDSVYSCCNILKVSYNKNQKELIFWLNNKPQALDFRDVKKKILQFPEK